MPERKARMEDVEYARGDDIDFGDLSGGDSGDELKRELRKTRKMSRDPDAIVAQARSEAAARGQADEIDVVRPRPSITQPRARPQMRVPSPPPNRVPAPDSDTDSEAEVGEAEEDGVDLAATLLPTGNDCKVQVRLESGAQLNVIRGHCIGHLSPASKDMMHGVLRGQKLSRDRLREMFENLYREWNSPQVKNMDPTLLARKMLRLPDGVINQVDLERQYQIRYTEIIGLKVLFDEKSMLNKDEQEGARYIGKFNEMLEL